MKKWKDFQIFLPDIRHISRLFAWWLTWGTPMTLELMVFSISVASRFGSDGDGGGQTAAGPWGIHCGFASKIEEKLWEKLFESNGGSACPPIVPSPYETPDLFFNLAIFGIWGHPSHPYW